MFVAFLQGFGTGGGLIVAIGAQNAFVLSEGVRGNYHIIIALICILCDAFFITLGVAGVGSTVAANPSVSQWVVWAGAAFLFVYGCRSLQSAIKGGSLDSNSRPVQSLKAAILATLAVTLLNPHFYLDTVILLGGISSRYDGNSRLLFWAGAVCASALWFVALSSGGRLLAPLFQRKSAWRVLDTLVWITMWSIAISLLVNGVPELQVAAL